MTGPAASRSGDIIDCLKTVGLDGALLTMDPDGLCLMEIDDFSVFRGRPWASLWPADSQALVLASIERALSGQVARFSADCPTAKGVMKSWDVFVTPIRDSDGAIIALQSLSQDVTERERKFSETVLVSRELAHRIQNLFAVVDGLIHISSRTQPEAKPFAESLRQRLLGLGQAISFIHPTGSREIEATPTTLKSLVQALLAPYAQSGAMISVTGDDAALGREAIPSVAMVINELATNAVKYGALRRPSGSLSVHLIRSDETFALDWREAGAALSLPASEPGFGTTLLDRTMCRQLSGSITRTWDQEGLVVRLDLPLSRLT